MQAKRFRYLESENARKKKLVAERLLEKAMLKELATPQTSEPGTPPAGRDAASTPFRSNRAPGVRGGQPAASRAKVYPDGSRR